MKRILLSVLVLFFVLSVSAQTPSGKTPVGSATLTQWNKGVQLADSGYQCTNFADTFALNRGWLKGIAGLLVRVADTSFYVRNQSMTRWVKVGGSGGVNNLTLSQVLNNGNSASGNSIDSLFQINVGEIVIPTLFGDSIAIVGGTGSQGIAITQYNNPNASTIEISPESGLGAHTVISSLNVTNGNTSVFNYPALGLNQTRTVPVSVNGTTANTGGNIVISSLPPSGTAGGDITGTYPNPTLIVVNSSPGVIGDASHTPVITVDSKGRSSSIVATAIQIDTNHVTGYSAGVALKKNISDSNLTEGYTTRYKTQQDSIALAAAIAARGITALTGDVTASGTGSVATTLATVNSNVGSFTNANITVNGKGLITAASSGAPGTDTTIIAGIDLTQSLTGKVKTLNADTTTGSTKLATQGFVARQTPATPNLLAVTTVGNTTNGVNFLPQGSATANPSNGNILFDSSGINYRDATGKTLNITKVLVTTTVRDSVQNLSGVIALESDTLRNTASKNYVLTHSGGGSIYAGVGLKKASDSSHLYTDSLVVPQILDITNMPQIQQWLAGYGVSQSNPVTNYPASSIDNKDFYFSTKNTGLTSTDFGGCLTNSTSGDSIRIATPFGVIVGNSIVSGHPQDSSGLEQINIAKPDVFGMISFRLSALTGYQWHNAGIGGQTTAQIRARFLRDVIGLSASANDGRGSITWGRLPAVCIIEGGINDIVQVSPVIPLSVTEANIEWMAQTCQQYGILGIVMNCGGDGESAFVTGAMQQNINSYNTWLKNGALNKYGCAVFDFNSVWNSSTYGGVSTYGNDNIHGGIYMNTSDSLHFTKAGYDTTAYMLVAQMKIPVCTKIAFCTALSPSTPIANYNRPTGITVAGTAYTLPNNAFDTIAVTAPLQDSVWVKITSSTNVTGTSTVTGFSSVYFKLDNNTTNQLWYTRNVNTKGGDSVMIGAMNLTTPSYQSSTTMITVNNDNSTAGKALIFNTSNNPSQERLIIGADATTATNINNANVTVSGGLGIGTDGPLFTTSVASSIAGVQLMNSGPANTTAKGIGYFSQGFYFESGISPKINDQITFSNNFSQTPTCNASGKNIAVVRDKNGWGSFSAGVNHDTTYGYVNDIVINNTCASCGDISYTTRSQKILLTSQAALAIYGTVDSIGVELTNIKAGVTGIGTATPDGSAKVDITDTARAFLVPRLTTTQRNNIGSLFVASSTAGSYTVIPTVTISGGTGTGAYLIPAILAGTSLSFKFRDAGSVGYGYNPSSIPTATLTGGTGSGGAVTLGVNGPARGDQIYNTTVDSLQWYNGTSWVNAGNSPSPTFTKINITTGSNATIGTATLSSGTVTVSTTAVTASSKIFLTDATTGALTNIGTPTVGTVTAGTSFVINSSNVLDTSNINWLIIN